MDINQKAIERAIVQEVADRYEDANNINDAVNDEIQNRVNAVFTKSVENRIEEKIKAIVDAGFEQEYTKAAEGFGGKGEKTTISKELSSLMKNYWSQRVDRNGKPSDGYNSVTRAEFLMTQICAEDFSKTVKPLAVNITAELKDSFRGQLAIHLDRLLDSLFKVRSIQDQGKADKPW